MLGQMLVELSDHKLRGELNRHKPSEAHLSRRAVE